jgi:hypothetical protein
VIEPLRFSRLKLFARSAAHFHANVGLEEAAELRKGSGLHSLLLGDPSKVVVCPMRRDERTKAYQEFLAANEGKQILSPKEMDSVFGMRASIEKHARAMELLEGTREKTLLFDWCGRRCRATPDVFTKKRLVELKTTRSSDPRRFKFQIRQLCYNGQLGFYDNALRIAGLADPVEHCIVAVESTKPYPVTVFSLTYELVDRGLRACRMWMETLNVCEQSKVWPAYAESDVEVDVEENDLDLDLSGLEDIEAAQ